MIATYFPLLLWIIVLQVLAVLSSTISSPDAWYDALVRSPLTPPGYVFATVWPVLYLCLAVYGWHLWRQDSTCAWQRRVYGLQLALNYLWSPVFFRWHQVSLALFIIGMMILMTLYLILRGQHSASRAWLALVPYLLWLFFAFYLTSYISAYMPLA